MSTKTSKVALIYTKNHAEGVQKAIRLLDINPIRGKAVALKPNFNTADPFPASTHNDTLHALVTVVKELGAASIVIAERSGPSNTDDVIEKKGILDMSKKLGFSIINLDKVDSQNWVHMQPDGSHWKNGFNFARVYAEAECVVQTCCLKTHRYGGHFTISLKNSVGMVERSFMNELHKNPYQRQMIAEINTAYTPDLIIMDGIEAFVSGGPMEGNKAQANVVLAGNDRVAIDATGVALLRFLGTTPEVMRGTVFQQDQIARAVELGIGIQSPAEIEFITESSDGKELATKLTNIILEK
jgi:uncharacterized protein (DUF362 family)